MYLWCTQGKTSMRVVTHPECGARTATTRAQPSPALWETALPRPAGWTPSRRSWRGKQSITTVLL